MSLIPKDLTPVYKATIASYASVCSDVRESHAPYANDRFLAMARP